MENKATMKDIAYGLGSAILNDIFRKEKQFPVDVDAVIFQTNIKCLNENGMDLYNEIMDNHEQFKMFARDFISSKLKYLLAEGFAYEEDGMVKLITKKDGV